MRKNKNFNHSALALAMIVLLAAVFSGCTSGTTNGSGTVTTSGTNVLLWSITSRQPGQSPENYRFMRSSVASSSLISSADPRTLQFPDGSTYSYQATSGSVTANNYYIGNTNDNYGSIADPLSETGQRQLNLDLEYPETLNGDYKVTLDSLSKTFNYPLSNYMDYVSEGDVQFGSGNTTFQASGDAIILNNQNNSNYRYFCRIYNDLQSPGVYQNYWTSADVRNIVWTNPDSLSDFILNQTVAPIGGSVRFDVPGEVLNTDSGTIIVIWAFDTTAVDTDSDGNFKSFTFAVSELRWEVEVQ